MPSFTNRLINESSPYLLQHAHNPVDWYPWGDEALGKARELDLPILVSIGYSACHWCHVMEHESFENEEVASYMNKHFINIKIDREERPDLDHIYMDAVQAIAGSGGWPLNVFLTTDTKPFYGGTYFPPQKAFNRPSWTDVLVFITDLWKNKRGELTKQADILIDHIQNSGNRMLKNLVDINGSKQGFVYEDCNTIAENILKSADISNGGFGGAPKFPQTFTIQYLLMYGHYFKHKPSADHAFLSLEKMLQGGIYDHIAGGLARYSTDAEWLAPHFEKMLYDNALLVSVLCDAYQISNRDIYRQGIKRTLSFFISEMKDKQGGYYAAIDADSDGIEGKFYVWDKNEIEEITGKDSRLCCEWYGVKDGGNWEGKNILHIKMQIEEFAKKNNLNVPDLEAKIEQWNSKLNKRRNKRIHPSTDDKILLGWNALLLTAFCKAYAVLQEEIYKTEAIRLYEFMVTAFKDKQDGYYHTYKKGVAKYPAFLDDLACLAQACINLQEITGNQEYLSDARKLCRYIIEQYRDEDSGMFAFTSKEQKDILVRKIEIYDGAVPSGNSLMAENLIYLGLVFDDREWMNMGVEMVFKLKEVILKYPTSFGIWATVLCKQTIGIQEVVLTGIQVDQLRSEIMNIYLPNKVFQSSIYDSELPLLKGKKYGERGQIYVCKNYACGIPLSTVNELKNVIIKEYLNIPVSNI